MTALGVVFVPQFPPERLRSVVEAADRAGLEELWLWEDCFLEGDRVSFIRSDGGLEALMAPTSAAENR